jgi:mono/diheme cytochrome c family protein
MLPRALAVTLPLLASLSAPAAAHAESSPGAGATLYQINCSACHQATGEGLKGIFPPLAQSDYLLADKERSIRIALQGIGGPIVVNGVEYQGVMPAPAPMDDQQVADVLTYVRSAWGNRGDAVTPAEVKQVRAALAATDADKNDPFAPLPPPPAGYRLREVVRLPVHAVKLATMPGVDWLLVLNNSGELYRLEPATGNLARVLVAKDYAELGAGKIDVLGMTIDSKKRLYLVTNQRVAEQPWHINRVVIFRSEPLDATGVPRLKPWLRSSYPWGFSYYNHGVCHIAEGPDGLIYVSSGARTDGGEVDGGIFKKETIYWKGGETDTTAAIWRIDPNADVPKIEVFARGIRNAWTFAWNDRGDLFSVSNGPDAHRPEEMDHVEQGKHYGFPYQYADFPATDKPYPYTPDVPPGLTITPAIRNFGPAAGGSETKPIATFDAHSSPAGMLFCNADWPAPLRGKMLVGRFGNFLLDDSYGYDILAVDLQRNAANVYEARMTTFFAPLARPIDFLQVGKKLYILEYTRPVGKHGTRPMNPGRILELSW